jgi:pentapeptide repeat protein
MAAARRNRACEFPLAMRILQTREKPQSFWEGLSRPRRRWAIPFFALDWICEWAAYYLGRWNFLEVLEYLSSFGVLVAVLFYFTESGDRVKQRHYQAWQVVNTAQGKGGSGGRIEALQELNADGVPLIGVDASGAFLHGVHLAGAKLVRANLSSADLRNSEFRKADLEDTDLRFANFRDSDLRSADLRGADLTESDLTEADLTNAQLAGASLGGADLRYADLAGVSWEKLSSVKGANIHGVRNAPVGFIEWATQHDAVNSTRDEPSQ